MPFDVKNDRAGRAVGVFGATLVGRRRCRWKQRAGADRLAQGQPGQGDAGPLASAAQARSVPLFQKLTGTQIELVPYRGAAPALTDLLAGQIDLRMAAEARRCCLISDTVKVFAIMGKTRWPSAPIPTIEESRRAELALPFRQAFWVAESTPEAIVAKLNAVAVAAWPTPRAPAPGRSRPGDSAARAADAGSVGAFHGPKSASGGDH